MAIGGLAGRLLRNWQCQLGILDVDDSRDEAAFGGHFQLTLRQFHRHGKAESLPRRRIHAVDHFDRGKDLDARMAGDLGDAKTIHRSDLESDQRSV
jgi:hypothetical protein